MSRRFDLDTIPPAVIAAALGALAILVAVWQASPALGFLLLVAAVAGGAFFVDKRRRQGKPAFPWAVEPAEQPEHRGSDLSEDRPSGADGEALPPRARSFGTITLKQGRIIDQWSALLEDCQGEGEGLLQAVEAILEKHQAPGVSWSRESVAPGWLKGLMGKRRDYLLLTHERFLDYLMCVGARDYGTNLDVSWYLTGSTKSALVQGLANVPGVAVAAGIYARAASLDVFDQQDLNAYVTVGHRAVRAAVEELMQRRKLDLARLERKSRGGVA